MSGKNNRIIYPASEKVYVGGEINKIRVGMRKIKLADSIFEVGNGECERKKNNPVVIYDTSGPYSDSKISTDFEAGIPRIREEWSTRRKDIVKLERLSSEYGRKRHTDKSLDSIRFPLQYLPYQAKESKIITQLYYAKRRIITPEMEYVTIRENQQIEALGLKSYITPDFVRKEIAAGRAIIPANVNHPEAEPMIIGKRFLVKINTNIECSSNPSTLQDEIERLIWHCKWGSDMVTDLSTGQYIHENREWIIRNSPLPIGTVPLYQALEKVDGNIEKLTWEIYKDTLIEQAEQGVDMFTVHAAMLRKHIDLLLPRLNGIVSHGGFIISEWMRIHNKENFLYTHFEDICEILKTYDVVLSLGNGLRPGSIYDANDSAQFAELQVMNKLITAAWEHFVQVITEGPGHVPMNKILENVKEQQYACKGAPFYTFGPLTTDIAIGYEHIASAIGAGLTAWYGTSMISCVTSSKEHPGSSKKDDIRDVILAYKIAAHAADLAKGHPGAQVRDNALSKARYESRLKDYCNLSIDPEKALKYLK